MKASKAIEDMSTSELRAHMDKLSKQAYVRKKYRGTIKETIYPHEYYVAERALRRKMAKEDTDHAIAMAEARAKLSELRNKCARTDLNSRGSEENSNG